MSEPATKDDIERLIAIMQESFARIHQNNIEALGRRFDNRTARLDRQCAVTEHIYRRLEGAK